MKNNDIWVFAKTIWAEARGEPLEGQIAVANVIINRARQGGWWGDEVAKVCRKPKHFFAGTRVIRTARRCAAWS